MTNISGEIWFITLYLRGVNILRFHAVKMALKFIIAALTLKIGKGR